MYRWNIENSNGMFGDGSDVICAWDMHVVYWVWQVWPKVMLERQGSDNHTSDIRHAEHRHKLLL